MEHDKISTDQSIDINALDVEEIDKISIQLGDEINAMVDVVCSKANNLLSVYGLETKMQIVIKKKDN